MRFSSTFCGWGWENYRQRTTESLIVHCCTIFLWDWTNVYSISSFGTKYLIYAYYQFWFRLLSYSLTGQLQAGDFLIIFMTSISAEKEFILSWPLPHYVSSPSFHGNDCFFLITWHIKNTEVKNVKKFVILINVKKICGGFYNWILSGQKQSSEGNVWKYDSLLL